ncbi:MAG: CpsD/CapB family tyrosine-protein kinase [Planctomycetes bacterium]|nr:CpsD/CapB family tyrosine-protein kinase [Planctomycetota bacterium]
MIGLEEKQKKQSQNILAVPQEFKEPITTLRDRLMLAYGIGQEAPRLIALTGVQGDTGVSTLAFLLGVSMAQQCRILLVDANQEATPLIDLIRNRYLPDFPAPPKGEEGMLAHVARNLDILSASRLKGESRYKFDSPVRLNELMLEYRQNYEYVLFDTPPVSSGSTALRIGSAADGVVLVIESERTLLEAAKRAKEQLGQVGARILGVVLNKRRLPIPGLLYR